MCIRDRRRSDRDALVAFHDSLSHESKRRRFLGDQEHLTPQLLDVLVDGVDGVEHIALAALAEPVDGPGQLVGTARLARAAHPRSAADVAVTVRDSWHGRGLATVMLPVLLSWRVPGITHLRTVVARNNPASLAMLRRVGRLREMGGDQDLVYVEVDLTARPDCCLLYTSRCV